MAFLAEERLIAILNVLSRIGDDAYESLALPDMPAPTYDDVPDPVLAGPQREGPDG